MQNAGQYGQGAASAHPPSQFVPSEPSPNGGSTTSSLRQFRKKDVDKSQLEPPKQMSESHVARVAPHNHYPPMTNDAYRFSSTHQFSGLNTQMKYSDHLAEAPQPNPMSTSVIQKPKTKDYMEMCNVQQQQHLSNQQYSPDNGQYMQKDAGQGYPPMYKPESQFFPKEPPHHQYQQMGHQAGSPKFNAMMNQNMRKYSPTPADNPFLNKLSKLHPSMARSIISDHHLQDAQPAYPPMDQRGMYGQQNPRFYTGPMHQSSPYSPNSNYGMSSPHPYPNYPASSCNYPRQLQMGGMGADSRYPQIGSSLSPSRRGYPEGMPMHMNYHAMHPKMQPGPNYGQYRGPEYAQHYQHRRGPPQDCFPQSCRPTQYMQSHHQNSGQDMQDMPGNTVSPSDSLKKFIESWIVEEEPTNEPNQLDGNVNLREKLRDDAPAGTVYMINANDVHYLENNGIPIVTSDSGGFQLSSDNLCLLKSGLLDNTGVVRLIEGGKEIAIDSSDNQERVVNLQIMEAPKSDCMVASKQLKPAEETRKVVIHQNTVLNPGTRGSQRVDQIPLQTPLEASMSITKELVDKNCSPINLEQLEQNLGFDDQTEPTETENEPSFISQEASNDQNDELSQHSDDSQYKSPGSKSMPIIDFFVDPPEAKDTNDSHEEDVKREINEDCCNETRTSPDCSHFEEREVKKEIVEPCTASSLNNANIEPVKTEPEETPEPGPAEEPRTEKRKRIFSVDDIMHNIGNSAPKQVPNQTQLIEIFLAKEVEFSSLEQLQSRSVKMEVKLDQLAAPQEENPPSNILKVNGSSTVLQVAGELMEITVDIVDGKKVIRVKPLTDSTTIIDVNANYEQPSVVGEDTQANVEDASKGDQVPVEDCEDAPTSPQAEEGDALKASQLVEEAPTLVKEEEVHQEELVQGDQGASSESEPSIEPSPLAVKAENSPEGPSACRDSVSSPATDTPEELVEECEMPRSEPIETDCIDPTNTSSPDSEECPQNGMENGLEPEMIGFEDHDHYEEPSLDFPLEDEVFIEEPPAQEVIVSDPLDGIGLMEEITLEPVTTTELDSFIPPEEVSEPSGKESSQEPEKDAIAIKAAKLEVQILSPTSTNVEDFSITQRANVYVKGGRKCSTDNDVSDYTFTTKAAKKLYDYDLQVQHDIVSSSKKEELPKSKKTVVKRSMRLTEKGQAKNDQKEMLKLLVDKRKRREEFRLKELKQQEIPAQGVIQEERGKEVDEEYVDFKELLRARRLKKLKKMQESNGDNVKPAPLTNGLSATKEKSPKVAKADLGPKEVSKRPHQLTPPDHPESKVLRLGEECSFQANPIISTPVPSRPNVVLVPSISELMEETGTTVSKRKISLADYVSRKRKATSADSGETKKPNLEAAEEEKPKPARTLSDMKTSFVIHSSDWEDSNSPSPVPITVKEETLIEDFSGLLPKPNSQKPVIDVNELSPALENREDKKLQEYKDKVDSQLNSLNIQIPKKSHAASGRPGPLSSPHSSDLVKRFLNNEKLSEKEMEKIRKIILYKRSIQDRKLIRSPSESTTESSFEGSPCSTYEVKNSSKVETDPSEVKLHIKKVNSKRKLALSGDVKVQSDQKKAIGYSVINRLGLDGLPKIVLKRHKKSSLVKEPVVELVKLDLDDLDRVQEEYKVTVSQNM